VINSRYCYWIFIGYISNRPWNFDIVRMCGDKLTLTLLVWICAFNLVEIAVDRLESKSDQVMVYVGILIVVIVYMSASHMQVCELT